MDVQTSDGERLLQVVKVMGILESNGRHRDGENSAYNEIEIRTVDYLIMHMVGLAAKLCNFAVMQD